MQENQGDDRTGDNFFIATSTKNRIQCFTTSIAASSSVVHAWFLGAVILPKWMKSKAAIKKANLKYAIKQRMEKDVDEVGKIARFIKSKIEELDRETTHHELSFHADNPRIELGLFGTEYPWTKHHLAYKSLQRRL
ncbi:hypothetical protein LXL04_033035 [Taraxacum kok-saghyz]